MLCKKYFTLFQWKTIRCVKYFLHNMCGMFLSRFSLYLVFRKCSEIQNTKWKMDFIRSLRTRTKRSWGPFHQLKIQIWDLKFEAFLQISVSSSSTVQSQISNSNPQTSNSNLSNRHTSVSLNIWRCEFELQIWKFEFKLLNRILLLRVIQIATKNRISWSVIRYFWHIATVWLTSLETVLHTQQIEPKN